MEIKVCPSCGSPEIEVAGNKVHCKACDVAFKVTQDGARVDDLDPLSKDRERLEKLEQDLGELKRGKNGDKSGDGDNETEEDKPLEEEAGGINFTNDGGSEND